jgi:hypothetical protein
MDDAVFGLALIVAGSCLAGFMALSMAARMLGVKGRKAVVALKVIYLILFLALGFAMVPLMVGAFFAALGEIVPAPLGPLRGNDMLVVYAFWLAYALGLAVALPRMMKAGFFGTEKGIKN